MANVQVPGFIPLRQKGRQGIERRRLPIASNAGRIRKGDALKFATASVALATATNTGVAGASMGVSYVNADGARVEMPVFPASTTYSGTTVFPHDGAFCYVPEDGADTIYMASCDEALTNADIDLNLIMVLNSTTTTYSDHELDATSKNTTNTFPWRLRGFVDDAQNDPDAADARLEVSVNTGMLNPALNTTGAA